MGMIIIISMIILSYYLIRGTLLLNNKYIMDGYTDEFQYNINYGGPIYKENNL